MNARAAHVHRVVHGSGPLPFFGPVAERLGGQNSRAWGNVRFRQRCRCGAERDILVNGDQDERGPWVPAPAVESGTVVPILPASRRAAS